MLRHYVAAALLARGAAAWANTEVQPQDCDSLSGVPLQILKYGDQEDYTLRRLQGGEWEKVFKVNWFDGHINAAGVFEDDDGAVFFFASFGGELCRFDEDQKVCFDGALEYSSPNAGVIVGSTYYYSKNLGRNGGETIQFVTNIDTDAPVYEISSLLSFSATLFEDAVLDFASVDENDGVDYIIDGSSGAYLLGLGADFEVIVIRLDDNGHPDAYAVLDASVEWGSGTSGPSGGFGAAYMFKNEESSTSVFFSSNAGVGTFQLDLEFAVNSACWNAGTATSGHAKCTSSTPVVRYEAASEESSSNDGLNCPFGVLGTESPTSVPTTAAPSAQPTTTSPSYGPTFDPTFEPTLEPTYEPTVAPIPAPSSKPSPAPSPLPNYAPSVDPTFEPTLEPTYEPTVAPIPAPTAAPSPGPSPEPSYAPSVDPTFEPTLEPTYEPTLSPTVHPTVSPSYAPTVDPTFEPTCAVSVLASMSSTHASPAGTHPRTQAQPHVRALDVPDAAAVARAVLGALARADVRAHHGPDLRADPRAELRAHGRALISTYISAVVRADGRPHL